MKRPNRDDFSACDCRRAQEEGASMCGGCGEYAAAVDAWIDSYDPYASADARNDELKDEDIHRG